MEIDRIKQLSQGIVDQYRKILSDEGINASSTLSQTADIEVEFDGVMLRVSLLLEPYWKYVEYGRRPGKMPPIDNIKEWIRVKPIIPDSNSGRVPSTNQLAYLIARKIGREGIPARHAINKTVYTDVTERIIEAIKAEITQQLKQQYLSS